jgi:hypothetical protein
MPSSNCLFCRGPAENATRDGRLSLCRKCATSKVMPLLKDVLGKDELVRVANELANEPSAADRKIQRLIADQARPIAQRKPLMEFSTSMPETPPRARALLKMARAAVQAGRTGFAKGVFEMAVEAGATVNIAAELSAGTGTPARPATKPTRAARRPTVPVEVQRLAVARAQARAEGQVYEGDVAGMVAKAGLKTYGDTELSTTAGTAATTRAPTRPAGKKAPPSKAQIAEMCRRAGLQAG